MFSVAKIITALACVLEICVAEKRTHFLPDDTYSLVGEIGNRQLGRCNYSFAWLSIPQGSHQDIYAHAAACSRLELHFIEAKKPISSYQRDIRSPQHQTFKASFEDELNRLNKDYTAQLVDLATLDALLQAVKVEDGVHSNAPLTMEDRLFYLSDRLGQYKMLAMLRPNRLPKIEIIPPPSQKAHFFPSYVLCYRKFCYDPPVKPLIYNSNALNQLRNSSHDYEYQFAKESKLNHHLQVQIIVYRILLALAVFMCILFGTASLILCFRLRASTKLPKKELRKNGMHIFPNGPNSPSYYQLNGKLGFPTHSPLIFADPNCGSLNVAHMHSDTASLHNTAISSNFSANELINHNAPSGNSYSAYALQPSYNPEGSNVLKLVQVTSRPSVNGTHMCMPYINRSSSPTSSAHIELRATDGYRTGSLGRHSEANSETSNRRRTPLQVIPLSMGMEINTPQFGSVRPFSHYTQSFKTIPTNVDQTLASQNSTGTVIHRYPGDINYSFTQTPHESIKSEHGPISQVNGAI